tara:strand:- start:668 stop:5497 length:4830 start_codon:yes stop_codon:yes gene_type:complete
LRWLHLTDLHWGNDNEQQTVAASSLLTAIAQADVQFDLVVITGDISYSGKISEYESFENNFLTPLRKIDNVKTAIVVSVPGNHDIDCSLGTPISWNSIGSSRQEKFFNFDERGREIRAMRLQNLQAYIDFTERNAILTPDFTQHPAGVIDLPNHPDIKLIALNTCYFSDFEQSDRHNTPAPYHPLTYLCRDVGTHNQVLVLGHYPISWFTPRSQKPFISALMDCSALYVHGHEHEIEAEFEATGLISLGFGASYVSPMNAEPTPFYRNSFAICALDDYLHVSPYVWDCENGRWIPEKQVPPSFKTNSSILNSGYKLAISRTPASAGSQAESQRNYNLAVEQRWSLEEAILLSQNEEDIWKEIISKLSLIHGIDTISTLPRDARGRNYVQFIITAKSGKYLVRTISAVGDTLSKKSVEETNTTIDTQSLDQAIILTLGSVSEDARTLADQLERNRKPIRIFDGKEINQRLSKSYLSNSIGRISENFGQRISIRPLFCSKGILLLITDQMSKTWFTVSDLQGTLEPSASEIVYELRQSRPRYMHLQYTATYDTEDKTSEQNREPQQEPFNLAEYKKRCFDIHDDIQYPGLAAIGLQIPNKSVKQIYVATAADSVRSDTEQESISLAITDAVNALDLPSDQRSQLQQALTGQYGISGTAESGAAAEMYELYGNILVEGDPGSGKSLFVRNSILNYCDTTTEKISWYSQHTPVFLPLAEVSRLKRHQSDLLSVCAEYARTTRLQISTADLEQLVTVGQAAFFFDGLDEIATIEERSEIVSEISSLVDQFAPLGNRFVLTSRPAAVQSVDVPSHLARLSLRGLTDDEMRLLAERILATSISNDGTVELSDAQRQTVDRLVSDCNEVPGIRRLGRNPLLLTLLVLIYANSGPMVAKRHIVYAQAIRTLVSVRQRQIEREMLSEADLRRELGIIALAIYEGMINEIPSRAEIHQLLMSNSASSFYENENSAAIDIFLQTISNSTGLVRFHQRSEEGGEDDVLTFMHHSFLEFYAAIKLVDNNFLTNLHQLALENRWREVIVLAAGIYADRAEVTDVVRELKSLPEVAEKVTGKLLILAIECASESDVPPVEAQSLLASWVLEYLINGAAKISSSAREELAKPLGNLLETTRSTSITQALSEGLKHEVPQVAAATIEVAGFLGSSLQSFSDVVDALEKACEREEPTVRAAIIRSAGRSTAFVNNATQKIMSRAITRGTAEERHAAFQSLELNIPLGAQFPLELREAVFGDGPYAHNAARVIVRSSAYRTPSGIDLELLDKALNALILSSRHNQGARLSLTLDYDELEGWLHSSDNVERIRAIRLIGLSEHNFVRAYELLIEIVLKESAPDIVTEALNGISRNANIHKLLRLDDVNSIRNLSRKPNSNVRIAATLALGQVPPLQDVIVHLIEQAIGCEKGSKYSEYEACIESLAHHADTNISASDFLVSEFVSELSKPERGWGRARISKILNLSAAIDLATPKIEDAAIRQIYAHIVDHKVPNEVQKSFLQLFGKIATPTTENAEFMERLVDQNIGVNRTHVIRSILSFVRRCRGKVEFVRAVYPNLQSIQQILLKNWDRESKREIGHDPESSLNTLRNCIIEIDRLLRSYRDIGFSA